MKDNIYFHFSKFLFTRMEGFQFVLLSWGPTDLYREWNITTFLSNTMLATPELMKRSINQYHVKQKTREVMTSQKLWNYGICWHIQKENDEKCSLAKNQPVSANCWGDISFVCSNDSIMINPSKISLERHVSTPAKFRRICVESSDHKRCLELSPHQFQCTKRLIFGKGAFFILFFLSILSNPIISQIWIFVMSHFSFLFGDTAMLTSWEVFLVINL